MKLHLPPSLLHSLLAVCVLATTVSAETLTEDFVFTDASQSAHGNSVNLDGNGRRYSYTVDFPNERGRWMNPSGAATVVLTDMKDILLNNVKAGNGYYNTATRTVKPTDIDISNSGSFTFSNGEEVSIFVPYYNDFGGGSRDLDTGSLSTDGNVRLSNVSAVTFSNNKGAVMRGGNFTLSNIRTALFTGHSSILFDESHKLTVSGSRPFDVLDSSTHQDITAKFQFVNELTFKDNSDSLFSYSYTTNTPPEFIECGLITFDNTTGIGRSAKFDNCVQIVFTNNEPTYRTIVSSSTFTDCETIEFTGNKSGYLGQTPVFEGIRKGLYITGNTSFGLFSGGFTASSNSPDMKAEVIITGNTINDSIALGVSSASMLNKFEYSKNIFNPGTVSNPSFGALELSHINEALITGNTITATGGNTFAHISAANDVGSLIISDNVATHSTSTSGGGVLIENAANIDSILITNNTLNTRFAINGFIKLGNLADFGTLEVTGNTLGFAEDEESGELVVEAQGSTKSPTMLFADSVITGRTGADGSLSSRVRIADNRIGIATNDCYSNNTIKVSDLLHFDVMGNYAYNTYKGFGQMELTNIANVNLSDNCLSTDVYQTNLHPFMFIKAIDLQGAESFTLANNLTQSQSLTVNGALCFDFNNDDVSTLNARNVTITGNASIGDAAHGGALYLYSGGAKKLLSFEDCGEVIITGNSAQASAIDKAAGGAIASMRSNSVSTTWSTRTIEFKGNDKTLIRGNYITDGTTIRLNAIDTISNVAFKARAGQTVEVYDGLAIGNTLNINGDDNDTAEYAGSVTISGAQAEEMLRALHEQLGHTAPPEDFAASLDISRTVSAGSVHVYGGEATLEDIILTSKADVTSAAAATLRMKNVRLTAGTDVSLSRVEFMGCNTISAATVTATEGAWTFHLGAENAADAVVDIIFTGADSTLTTENQQFRVSYDSLLAPGRYKLVTYDSSKGAWVGAGAVSLSGVQSAGIDLPGYGDVYYTIKGNTYTLWFDYNGDRYTGEMPKPRPATALRWAAASGEWTTGAGAELWSGVVTDRNFYTGDIAVFRAAAQVTVADVVRPEDVLVDLDEGSVVFTAKGEGQITGTASITKTGKGELVLNLANAYTGYQAEDGRMVGAVLKDGKLTVGNARALGHVDSAVLVQGGELDLGGLAVANDIVITAESAILNGAENFAGKFTLESGDVTGEVGATLHLAQGAELLSGSLSHDITGAGNIVKNGSGRVTLTGNVETDGRLEVNKGTLELSGAKYTGDIDLKGGALTMNRTTYSGAIAVAKGATLTASQFNFSGHLMLSSGAIVSLDGLMLRQGDTLTMGANLQKGNVTLAGGTMNIYGKRTLYKGNLELSGGAITIAYPINNNGGTDLGQLIVDGSIRATEQTTLTIENFNKLENGTYSLMLARTVTDPDVENIYVPELQGARIETLLKSPVTTPAPYGNLQGFFWHINLTLQRETLTWIKGKTEVWGLQEDTPWRISSTASGNDCFYNLDNVIFEDAGAAPIKGEVRPGSITVQGEGNTTFTGSGSITGAAQLNKLNGGTLEIATDNKDYSGNVLVSGGTLLVNHDHALGSARVMIYRGATYSVSNGRRISNAQVGFTGESFIHDAKGGTAHIAFVNNPRVSGSYTLAAGNTLEIVNGGVAAFSGNFTFAGGTLQINTETGTFDLTDSSVSFGSGLTTIDVLGWQAKENKSYSLIYFGDDMDAGVLSHFTVAGLDEGAWDISFDKDNHALVLDIKETTPPAGDVTDPDNPDNPDNPNNPDDPNNPGDITKPTPRIPSLSRNQSAALSALRAIRAQKPEGNLGAYARAALELAEGENGPAAAAELLDRLSGAELATAMTSQALGNLTHLRRLRANMGSAQSVDATGKNALYLVGYDDMHTIDESAEGLGIKRTEWGGMLGYERALGERSLMGAALSRGSADVTPTGRSGYKETATRLDLYLIAGFGSGWQSVTSLGLGQHAFDISRTIAPGCTANASMDGSSINFQQELSYTIRTSESSSWQPFASLEISSNSIDAFTESGAGTASLAGGSQSATAIDITLGARYIHSFAMAGSKGSLSLQAAIIAAAGDTAADMDLRFTGAPGTGFTVGAAGYDGVGFNLGASVTLPLSKSTAITAGASATLRSGCEETGANIGLRIVF